ncbi:hypothetical protein [Aeromicrobium sp. Sec7.5]|uniref:hypothetical protein n=1 Tax=Aeromicrobium sp. Sec7.5 TaxID=3121276 RepID=UPI002FE444BF
MNDEQPKKVVRRVVKRTVVRPVSDVGRDERPTVAAPGRAAAPRTRTVTNPSTGRTVTLGGRPAAREGAAASTATPTKKTSPVAKASGRSAPAPAPAKPKVPRRSPRDVLDDWRLSVSDRSAGAGRAVRSGTGAVGSGVRSVGRRVVGVRLPHWPDVRGVLATAIVTGLVVVGLGSATLELFDRVFGVKSGGAWGVLAFALIAVAAFVTSRVVLGWFGHPSAVVTAALAQLFGIVLLLILLPTNAQSLWSLLIVPAVSVASHLAAHGGVLLAEAEDGRDPSAEAEARDGVTVR